MYDKLNKYVDVVVGGQAGSEGKGEVVAQLSIQNDYTGAVRCGGSNAGHTVHTQDNTEYIFQVLPVLGLIDPNISLYVGAESFFTIEEIRREIEILESVWGSEQEERIYIDSKAAIIEEKHKKKESEKHLGKDIGSTTHGVGAARVEKIWRSAGNIRLAEEYSQLDDIVSEKSHQLDERLSDGK